MITKYKFDRKISNVIHDKDSSPCNIGLNITEPVIIRISKFTEDSVKNFTNDMDRAYTTNQKIIPIICDSYGGQVYSLMAMIDIINKARIPVATIIEGKAMSCGAILAACGTKGHRYMGENATIMIHDVSSGSIGKVSEIQASAKEAERLNKLVFRILDERCGKKENYIWDKLQDTGRADWFLTSKMAKKHGLIDHIGIPDMNVQVKVKYSLSLEK